MPKRSKRKKVWYPENLFHEVMEYDEPEFERAVYRYNEKFNSNFLPEEVARALKRWKKVQGKNE